MQDIFPFLRITGSTSKEQVLQLADYITQFKEILEFTLRNITVENLSPDLVNKLNELGADIQKAKDDKEEEFAQLTGSTLTISDVCESNQFKDAVNKELSGTFTVNYDTGHLEYGLPDEEGN